MADPFRIWKTGEKFQPTASQLSAWTHAARKAARSDRAGGGLNADLASQHCLWCYAKNTSGAARERGGIVSLKGAVVAFEENAEAFKNDCELKAIAPDPSLMTGIWLDPVSDGGIAKAAFTGLVAVQVDVLSEAHKCAAVVAGQYDKLQSADAGFVIAAIAEEDEEEPEAPRWAIVQIGGGGGGPGLIYGLLVDTVPAKDS